MTVCHARIIASAAVLMAISVLGPGTRLRAQQAQQPLDRLRALAEQCDAVAQTQWGHGKASRR